MTTDTHDATSLVAPSLAAMQLASQLGQTQELWLHRLANWRRPERKSPIAFHTNDAGHPGYSLDALNTFIAVQLSRQALVAETRDISPVKAAAISQLENPDVKPHVRVSFVIPGVSQSVFAVSTSTARQLAKMLTKSADDVDSFKSPTDME